ncbi:MAG: TlpA disulfide reductase family protein [Chloroflexota bacterium]|nr:TlpA disulfide reductase family protein [Chloroflexota bacterium]
MSEMRAESTWWNMLVKGIAIAVPVALIIGGAVGLFLAWNQASLPGDPMAQRLPDIELETLEGQPMNLQDLAGQPLLLNFWATWCPPCIEEMPALQEAQLAYGNNDVLIVAINQGEDRAAVQEFVDRHGMSLLVLLDEQGSARQYLDVDYLPTTFFVDSFGVIRSRWESLLEREQMRQGIRALN